MEIEIALRKHELPFEFTKLALAEAKKLPDEVRASERKGREDLRDLPLVPIDGETARDFDDAVYCAKNGRGYRLVVAIADVSHYVRPGSALDNESQERGNSVYFPRRVIPMLPEKLSNGLCSLNPQVDRLCMACDMDISAAGKIQRYRFYPGVMHSKAWLTYTEVAAALFDKDAAALDKLRELLPQLDALDALYRVLAKAREKRGDRLRDDRNHHGVRRERWKKRWAPSAKGDICYRTARCWKSPTPPNYSAVPTTR